MDATSEQAKVIAALCGCSPAEAASLKEVREYELEPLYTFVIGAAEADGTVVISLWYKRHVRIRLEIKTDGKIDINSIQSKTFVQRCRSFQQILSDLDAASEVVGAPHYLAVLYDRFAAANELLAADAPA